MTENVKTLHFKLQFNDFEHYAQTVIGWGLDFTQLDSGRFEADLHQIVTPDTIVAETRFNRNLSQKGDLPEGMTSFGILAENTAPCLWRNEEMSFDRLVVFPQGGELDASSFAGFHCYAFSIANHLLTERLQWEDQPDLNKLLKHGGVVKGAPERLLKLRHFFKQLFLHVENNPELIHSQPFQKNLSDEVFRHTLGILCAREKNNESLPFRKHAQLIRNIEPWLLETLHENHSVHDLCNTFQVNERTLLRIFMQWYGVSPKQYLLALRLNNVRKELYQASPLLDKVTDIANRWDFWHMGHFAMIYQRQFGELPSETLASGRH